MSAHTPGPWAVIAFSRNDAVLSVAERGVVAHVLDPEGGSVVERHANAHIIAAAPDLLEELREARNALQWYRETFPEADGRGDDEVIARIDAAIAKAEGKS